MSTGTVPVTYFPLLQLLPCYNGKNSKHNCIVGTAPTIDNVINICFYRKDLIYGTGTSVVNKSVPGIRYFTVCQAENF